MMPAVNFPIASLTGSRPPAHSVLSTSIIRSRSMVVRLARVKLVVWLASCN